MSEVVELSRLCIEMGLVGFLHYPTTAHPAMQELAEKGGGVTVGILLDYISADTQYVGFFFGALLPEYVAGGDALRLQYLPSEFVPPSLETPAGRELFEYSAADRLL